jgi:AcrR family transcriptional regulator
MARSAKKPAKKRQPLSAERIAEAALALIDRAGLDGFSFRVLARDLGCEAMSIYHYYPSKAHLYDALVEMCLAEMPVPSPDLPWQTQFLEVGRAMRKVALRHPGFLLYLIIHRLNNRAGLTFLERVIRIFDATGLPLELRARHFRAVSHYIMGGTLDEAMGFAKGPSAVDPVPADVARRDFPAITAVGPYFAPKYHEAMFESGLVTLIDKIAADAAALAAEKTAGPGAPRSS